MSESEQATSSGFSNQQVSAVSVKIPPFWSNDPALWFLQVEVQFTLKNITSRLTKFDFIVSSLEHQVALHVRILILNPPANSYMCTLIRLLKTMSIEVGSGMVAKQSSTYRQKKVGR